MRMVVASLVLGGCVVGGGEAAWTFEDAEGVEIHLTNGEVTIESEAERVDTEARWEGGGIGRAARPDTWLDDDGWAVIDAGGGLGGGELDVRVPLGVPIIATLDSGDMEIDLDAMADLDACVGAGDLSIEVPAGAWNLQLDTAVGDQSYEGILHDPEAPYSLRACVATGELTVQAF